MAEPEKTDSTNDAPPEAPGRKGTPLRKAFQSTGHTAKIMPSATKALAASTPSLRLNDLVQVPRLSDLVRVPTAQDLLAPFTQQIFDRIEVMRRPAVLHAAAIIEQVHRPLLDLNLETNRRLLEAMRPTWEQGLRAQDLWARQLLATPLLTVRAPTVQSLLDGPWVAAIDGIRRQLAGYHQELVRQMLADLMPTARSLLDQMMGGPEWAAFVARLLHAAWRRLHYAAVYDDTDDLEEFVRRVMDAHVTDNRLEAAKTVLLAERFRQPDLDQKPPTLAQMRHWVIKEHRNWQRIGDTQLLHAKVDSLDRQIPGGYGTVGGLKADPLDVEAQALADVIDDPFLLYILSNLTPQQKAVLHHRANHGLTWKEAAAEPGYPVGLAEQTRRRLLYLKAEYQRRHPAALQTSGVNGRTR
jgi:hypothetical protein